MHEIHEENFKIHMYIKLKKNKKTDNTVNTEHIQLSKKYLAVWD